MKPNKKEEPIILKNEIELVELLPFSKITTIIKGEKKTKDDLNHNIKTSKNTIRTLVNKNTAAVDNTTKVRKRRDYRQCSALMRFIDGLKRCQFGENGEITQNIPILKSYYKELDIKRKKIINSKIDAGALTYLCLNDGKSMVKKRLLNTQEKQYTISGNMTTSTFKDINSYLYKKDLERKEKINNEKYHLNINNSATGDNALHNKYNSSSLENKIKYNNNNEKSNIPILSLKNIKEDNYEIKNHNKKKESFKSLLTMNTLNTVNSIGTNLTINTINNNKINNEYYNHYGHSGSGLDSINSKKRKVIIDERNNEHYICNSTNSFLSSNSYRTISNNGLKTDKLKNILKYNSNDTVKNTINNNDIGHIGLNSNSTLNSENINNIKSIYNIYNSPNFNTIETNTTDRTKKYRSKIKDIYEENEIGTENKKFGCLSENTEAKPKTKTFSLIQKINNDAIPLNGLYYPKKQYTNNNNNCTTNEKHRVTKLKLKSNVLSNICQNMNSINSEVETIEQEKRLEKDNFNRTAINFNKLKIYNGIEQKQNIYNSQNRTRNNFYLNEINNESNFYSYNNIMSEVDTLNTGRKKLKKDLKKIVRRSSYNRPIMMSKQLKEDAEVILGVNFKGHSMKVKRHKKFVNKNINNMTSQENPDANSKNCNLKSSSSDKISDKKRLEKDRKKNQQMAKKKKSILELSDEISNMNENTLKNFGYTVLEKYWERTGGNMPFHLRIKEIEKRKKLVEKTDYNNNLLKKLRYTLQIYKNKMKEIYEKIEETNESNEKN